MHELFSNEKFKVSRRSSGRKKRWVRQLCLSENTHSQFYKRDDHTLPFTLSRGIKAAMAVIPSSSDAEHKISWGQVQTLKHCTWLKKQWNFLSIPFFFSVEIVFNLDVLLIYFSVTEAFPLFSKILFIDSFPNYSSSPSLLPLPSQSVNTWRRKYLDLQNYTKIYLQEWITQPILLIKST